MVYKKGKMPFHAINGWWNGVPLWPREDLTESQSQGRTAGPEPVYKGVAQHATGWDEAQETLPWLRINIFWCWIFRLPVDFWVFASMNIKSLWEFWLRDCFLQGSFFVSPVCTWYLQDQTTYQVVNIPMVIRSSRTDVLPCFAHLWYRLQPQVPTTY